VLRSQRPSTFGPRSPVFLPALAAASLLVAASFQLTFPPISNLPPKSDLAPRRVREPAGPQVAEYPAILKKPIFAPDRAPDPKDMAISGSMTGYAVLGIGLAGDAATALIRTPSGTIERVRPGEDVDGWKLLSVGPSELTLAKDNEHRILTVAPQPVAPPVPVKPASVTSDDQSDDSTDDQNATNDDDSQNNNGLSP